MRPPAPGPAPAPDIASGKGIAPGKAARYRDAAFLLPLAGLFLLLPPVVGLFVSPVTLFGIPLVVAYVFGLWAALILAAFRLSRRLRDPEYRTPSTTDRIPGTPPGVP